MACSSDCSGQAPGVRPSDVTRVAAVFAPGVDQDQLSGAERRSGEGRVQNARVGPSADDRPEGKGIGPIAEERRLEGDLHLALSPPRLEQRRDAGKAGSRRRSGQPRRRGSNARRRHAGGDRAVRDLPFRVVAQGADHRVGGTPRTVFACALSGRFRAGTRTRDRRNWRRRQRRGAGPESASVCA
jgi:hypothetical protein